MSTTYSPDIAPELEPEIVLWQPTGHRRAGGPPIASLGAVAVLALAAGAVALGALAIGALAVGRLDIGRARVRRLDVDDLGVGRLRRLRRAF